MKTVLSRPENTGVYSRYYHAIRILKFIRTPCQVLSAITSFGIVYTYCEQSFNPVFPQYAFGFGLSAALITVIITELIIRYIGRQFTRDAINAGTDRISSLTIVFGGLTILAFGFNVATSWYGSFIAIEMGDEYLNQGYRMKQDSSHKASLMKIKEQFVQDSIIQSGELAGQHHLNITSLSSQVISTQTELQNLRVRNFTSYTNFSNKKKQLENQIQSQLAAIQQAKADSATAVNNALADARGIRDQRLKGVQTQYLLLTKEHEAELKSTGKGLGVLALIANLFVVLGIYSEEKYKKEAKIEEQVLPDPIEQMPNLFLAWLSARKERLAVQSYNRLFKFETNTPALVTPTLPGGLIEFDSLEQPIILVEYDDNGKQFKAVSKTKKPQVVLEAEDVNTAVNEEIIPSEAHNGEEVLTVAQKRLAELFEAAREDSDNNRLKLLQYTIQLGVRFNPKPEIFHQYIDQEGGRWHTKRTASPNLKVYQERYQKKETNELAFLRMRYWEALIFLLEELTRLRIQSIEELEDYIEVMLIKGGNS